MKKELTFSVDCTLKNVYHLKCKDNFLFLNKKKERNIHFFYIWGVSRQLSQSTAREPQIVLFLTHVYDTKKYLKNCLISAFDVLFPQLSNDAGSFFEIFHFHLQNLFHILFLAKNISGTL